MLLTFKKVFEASCYSTFHNIVYRIDNNKYLYLVMPNTVAQHTAFGKNSSVVIFKKSQYSISKVSLKKVILSKR